MIGLFMPISFMLQLQLQIRMKLTVLRLLLKRILLLIQITVQIMLIMLIPLLIVLKTELAKSIYSQGGIFRCLLFENRLIRSFNPIDRGRHTHVHGTKLNLNP